MCLFTKKVYKYPELILAVPVQAEFSLKLDVVVCSMVEILMYLYIQHIRWFEMLLKYTIQTILANKMRHSKRTKFDRKVISSLNQISSHR